MSEEAFQVALGQHLVSGFVHRTPWLWKALANLETASLKEQLAQVEVKRPVWIAGIARAGSTILLEAMASHPDVATHQYRDFPFVSIPHFWRTTLDRANPEPEPASERAHGDRLMVSSHSPEAFEEVLWMMFFKNLHNPARSSVLDMTTSNPKFEAFFEQHMRKLQLVMGRARYVAKENYNVTRLGYLRRMFPDARFVVPIRHPRDHIASLRKQHRIFCDAAKKHPRSVAHLDRVGHYEFGAHRTPINAGDSEVVRSIEDLWAGGEEVRGWARYWAHVYGFISEQVDMGELGEAALFVRYDDLCADPGEKLEELLGHAELMDSAIIDRFREGISAPTYYEPTFSAIEEAAIVEECGAVAGRFGWSLQ